MLELFAGLAGFMVLLALLGPGGGSAPVPSLPTEDPGLFARVSEWTRRLYPSSGLRREGDPVVDAVHGEVDQLANDGTATHDARRRAQIVSMLLEGGDVSAAVDKLVAWASALQKEGA